MGIYNGSHTGDEIDAAVNAILTRFDASNTNVTSGTSDNVLFSKESIVVGANGCTILDNQGNPFYLARTDGEVETLTYASWSGVNVKALYSVFIDVSKLSRGERVSSIVGCTLAIATVSATFRNYFSKPNEYILFAHIHKGNIFPAGIFAKPEFIGQYT